MAIYQGNHFCGFIDTETKWLGYHYCNSDGSFYQRNTDGSIYRDNGKGNCYFISPTGDMFIPWKNVPQYHQPCGVHCCHSVIYMKPPKDVYDPHPKSVEESSTIPDEEEDRKVHDHRCETHSKPSSKKIRAPSPIWCTDEDSEYEEEQPVHHSTKYDYDSRRDRKHDTNQDGTKRSRSSSPPPRSSPHTSASPRKKRQDNVSRTDTLRNRTGDSSSQSSSSPSRSVNREHKPSHKRSSAVEVKEKVVEGRKQLKLKEKKRPFNKIN